jgi:hypothetical protein
LYHLHPAEHAQHILLSLKTEQNAQMKMIRSVRSFWNYVKTCEQLKALDEELADSSQNPQLSMRQQTGKPVM